MRTSQEVRELVEIFKDLHSLLVLGATVYFALISVLNGILAAKGVIPFSTYVSAHTLVFLNIFFGFAYLIYTTFFKGRVYLRYEDTIRKAFITFAIAGVVLHVVLAIVQLSLLSSVSALASSLYLALLGGAYALVALTENAFFIGVIGDFVAEYFGRTKQANILASIVSALFAGATAAVFHIGVYGGSLTALAVVAFWFGFWTLASLEMRSTLYADLHHMIGNYFGFVWSAVEVVL